MFNLCKRIVSSDCASRILSGGFNSARSNSIVYNPTCIWGSMTNIHTTTTKEYERIAPTSISFVKNVLEEEGRLQDTRGYGGPLDEKLDIVHIKMKRNNTFVTLTDYQGNTKLSASMGCVEELKGGAKGSRYAAEATCEHVGRLARNLGLKSVVMRVNGFTHFKKKKQAIFAFKEGFTHGRGDRNPIVYIEDTTRRPHNGCRLPKKRRV